MGYFETKEGENITGDKDPTTSQLDSHGVSGRAVKSVWRRARIPGRGFGGQKIRRRASFSREFWPSSLKSRDYSSLRSGAGVRGRWLYFWKNLGGDRRVGGENVQETGHEGESISPRGGTRDVLVDDKK